MHPKVRQRFHEIIRECGVQPRKALEVGGVMGPNSLLRCPELEGAERVCLNLVAMPSTDEITAVVGNANDMSVFDAESFDLIVSNATLEHDKHFWLSLAEMRRVLAPGGLMIIGVPGYTKDPKRDHGKSTHTYRVHYRFDYYRFSEQAVREVFLDGMEDVDVQPILAPPRLIGRGFKPGGERPRVIRPTAARSSQTRAPTTASSPPARRGRVSLRKRLSRFMGRWRARKR